MRYYLIAKMRVTDRGWVEAYVRDVTRLVGQHGRRYLARTSNGETLEGERARLPVIAITEWPSREVAMAFYEGEAYRPYRESRIAGTISELVLLPGEDVTGMAHIE